MGGAYNKVYKVLVGKPHEKGPRGRYMRNWEHNIKMNFRELEYEDRNWI